MAKPRGYRGPGYLYRYGGQHPTLPAWPATTVIEDAPTCHLCSWVPWAGRWRIKTTHGQCHHARAA